MAVSRALCEKTLDFSQDLVDNGAIPAYSAPLAVDCHGPGETTSLEEESMAKTNGSKARPASKTAMFSSLAEKTGLTKKQVTEFFNALTDMIKHEMSKRGTGVVTIPGLLKIARVEKPATKARQGRNPQTGEAMMIAPKPKRTIVKTRPLKALKDMVHL
jgi:nucleoid DNA-binding protein